MPLCQLGVRLETKEVPGGGLNHRDVKVQLPWGPGVDLGHAAARKHRRQQREHHHQHHQSHQNQRNHTHGQPHRQSAGPPQTQPPSSIHHSLNSGDDSSGSGGGGGGGGERTPTTPHHGASDSSHSLLTQVTSVVGPDMIRRGAGASRRVVPPPTWSHPRHADLGLSGFLSGPNPYLDPPNLYGHSEAFHSGAGSPSGSGGSSGGRSSSGSQVMTWDGGLGVAGGGSDLNDAVPFFVPPVANLAPKVVEPPLVPSRDMGPRVATVVTSFEDLLVAVAHVKHFLGPDRSTPPPQEFPVEVIAPAAVLAIQESPRRSRRRRMRHDRRVKGGGGHDDEQRRRRERKGVKCGVSSGGELGRRSTITDANRHGTSDRRGEGNRSGNSSSGGSGGSSEEDEEYVGMGRKNQKETKGSLRAMRKDSTNDAEAAAGKLRVSEWLDSHDRRSDYDEKDDDDDKDEDDDDEEESKSDRSFQGGTSSQDDAIRDRRRQNQRQRGGGGGRVGEEDDFSHSESGSEEDDDDAVGDEDEDEEEDEAEMLTLADVEEEEEADPDVTVSVRLQILGLEFMLVDDWWVQKVSTILDFRCEASSFDVLLTVTHF